MTDAQTTESHTTMLRPPEITGTKRPLTRRQKWALRYLIQKGIEDHFHARSADWKAPLAKRVRESIQNAPKKAVRVLSVDFRESGSIGIQIWVGDDTNVWTWYTFTGSIGKRGGLSAFDARRTKDGHVRRTRLTGSDARIFGWDSI